MTRQLLADRIPAEQMEDFLDDFEAYRVDEVLGAYKPYPQVINNALARDREAAWGIEHRDSDGEAHLRRRADLGPAPRRAAMRSRVIAKRDPRW